MADSIIVLVNEVARLSPDVRNYQGKNPNSSMNDHVGSSMCFSLLGTILFLISPWFILLELAMWCFYSVFTEFVIQKDKNIGVRIQNVWAQVIERSVGFVVLAPLKLLTLF